MKGIEANLREEMYIPMDVIERGGYSVHTNKTITVAMSNSFH